MKRIGLLLAFVAIASTALEAQQYIPKQDGKTAKTTVVKSKKPLKKVKKIKEAPVKKVPATSRIKK
jgi:hypothetical protein